MKPSFRCAPKAPRGQIISPPTFLKALGSRGRQEVLDIFNLSFFTGKSAQTWKIAIIMPLKKEGKTTGIHILIQTT